MIIEYTLKNTDRYGKATIVRLCGKFRDLEHFDSFKKVEESRGWKVLAYCVMG